MQHGRRVEPTPPESALAAEMFDHFCSAGTMKQVLALHREMCNTLTLRPNRFPVFYPKIKAKLSNSWKAQALFKKVDARANNKLYAKGRACAQNKVLIIGAGPCGLRAAIECQLLGAKVILVEKREMMSRNNVVHLWPFVIHDLRALGAKKFFGKFCAGSIDHISIRQLQLILLKICLLLGVEIHENVTFEDIIEPTVTDNAEKLGWRARVSPSDHPVTRYEFDNLIGADGKRNTLKGFIKKELKAKLAIGITVNFINRHTEIESTTPEISGVSFVFRQKFFNEMRQETGIDLENIVYYRDDTHYFVMTVRKKSLLNKGVLLRDHKDVSSLLSITNLDRGALLRFAQQAARFSTDYRMPLEDFALNHYGEPDVSLFDFTTMFAATNASLVRERLGHRLLVQLVGDSLLEPFWPTGSGVGRGFLSALDAVWAVRSAAAVPPPHPLRVIAERETVYRLLAQTVPGNLSKPVSSYTLDPGTRYPNLVRHTVAPHEVARLYHSDEPLPLDASNSSRKRKKESVVPEEVVASWAGLRETGAPSEEVLATLVRRYRPDLLPPEAPDRAVCEVLQYEFGIRPIGSPGGRDTSDANVRAYLQQVYQAFKGEVPHIEHNTDVFSQIKESQKLERLRDKPPEEKRPDSGRKSRKRKTPRAQVSSRASHLLNPLKIDEAEMIQDRARLDELDALKEQSLVHRRRNLDTSDAVRKELTGPILITKLSANRLAYVQQLLLGKDVSNLNEFICDDEESCTKSVGTSEHEFGRGCDRDSLRSQSMPSIPLITEDCEVQLRRSKSESNLAINVLQTDTEHTEQRTTSDIEQNVDLQLLSDSFEGIHLNEATSPRHEWRYSQLKLQELEKVDDDQILLNTETKHSPVSARQLPSGRPLVGDSATHYNKLMNYKRRIMSGQSLRESHRPSFGLKRHRFEKSLRMLEEETKDAGCSTVDLENDVGLQQYRASGLCFGERVKTIERQLKNSDESRVVCGSSKGVGGGARVAKLAAELAGSSSSTPKATKPNKPKDLMRSIGKLHREDWNVKEIEKKIQENRLGRPAPSSAEKVPMWNKDQFLDKQRRLEKGDDDGGKWGEIDETLNKLDQKLRDSGRPDQGTKKVAKLATKFAKIEEPKIEKEIATARDMSKRSWRGGGEGRGAGGLGGAASGVQCARCHTLVFAAETVSADGLQFHRACFRCAVCEAALRPGNYIMERYGGRLICLRHGGLGASDHAFPPRASAIGGAGTEGGVAEAMAGVGRVPLPERISIDISDSGAREIDEDEMTDRNFLPSETSIAGGLSDEEESSSDEFKDAVSDDEGELGGAPRGGGKEAVASDGDAPYHRYHAPYSQLYFSDDSFGYDDYSDDGQESSGGESCSRMRAAREERRREVPAALHPPTDSSEVETDESSSSSEESSSATEVSTDSEFEREECSPFAPSVPSPPAAPAAPAITVTPAPPPRELPLSRARSAGGLATKRALELKRRYLLGEPSPPTVRKSDSTSRLDTKLEAVRTTISRFQKLLNPAPPQPVPDILQNISRAIVDATAPPVETDTLSEESSVTDVPQATPPRLEVHDEVGELIQLDSLVIVDVETKDDEREDKVEVPPTPSITAPTVLTRESESSESCKDATTLALTETELSDWAIESAVLEDHSPEDDKGTRTLDKSPRALRGPKMVHDAKNLIAVSSHVCGRSSPPEPIMYSNALEHFEFADEGEQDPTINTPVTPRNEGYMELMDVDYRDHSPVNDRSMNFIETHFSEMMKPNQNENEQQNVSITFIHSLPEALQDDTVEMRYSELDKRLNNDVDLIETITNSGFKSPHLLLDLEKQTSRKNGEYTQIISSDEPISPPRDSNLDTPIVEAFSHSYFANKDIVKPPDSLTAFTPLSPPVSSSCRMMYKDISEPLRATSASSGSFAPSLELSTSVNMSSGSASPSTPLPTREKVQEIKREREEQTEVVRRLVLERMGLSPREPRRKTRAPPTCACSAPPVPPRPPTPPPPRPAPPLSHTNSLSDPELAAGRRRKGFMNNLSTLLLRTRSKISSPANDRSKLSSQHKSTSALANHDAPPVPPPVPPLPTRYIRRYTINVITTVKKGTRLSSQDATARRPSMCQEHVEESTRLTQDANARRSSNYEEHVPVSTRLTQDANARRPSNYQEHVPVSTRLTQDANARRASKYEEHEQVSTRLTQDANARRPSNYQEHVPVSTRLTPDANARRPSNYQEHVPVSTRLTQDANARRPSNYQEHVPVSTRLTPDANARRPSNYQEHVPVSTRLTQDANARRFSNYEEHEQVSTRLTQDANARRSSNYQEHMPVSTRLTPDANARRPSKYQEHVPVSTRLTQDADACRSSNYQEHVPVSTRLTQDANARRPSNYQEHVPVSTRLTQDANARRPSNYQEHVPVSTRLTPDANARRPSNYQELVQVSTRPTEDANARRPSNYQEHVQESTRLTQDANARRPSNYQEHVQESTRLTQDANGNRSSCCQRRVQESTRLMQDTTTRRSSKCQGHENGDAASRRLAHLQRRLSRPLSAEQQAAAVAELVQVSAQRDAHKAMVAADRLRWSSGDGK